MSVEYYRELIADMLKDLLYIADDGPMSRSSYTVQAINEQIFLLRAADDAEHRAQTVRTPPPTNESKGGEYDRSLIADMLGMYAELLESSDQAGHYTQATILEQATLLGDADNRDAAGVHTASHPKAASAGWLPIESAPTDGAWVQLTGGTINYGWDGDEPPPVVSGQFTTDLNGSKTDGHWQFAWYDGGYYGEYCAPTHWRPLPSPPAVGGED